MTRDNLHLLPSPEGGRAGMAAYRPYTRALLRRYMRLAVDLGRLPSVLGGLCFRPRISSYRVHTFEDTVIFVHDIEHAFERVGRRHMEIVAGVVLLDYSLPEAALRMGITVQRAERRYCIAIDELSAVLLACGLLTPIFPADADEEGDAEVADAAANTNADASLPPRIPPAAVRQLPGGHNLQGLRNAQGLRRLMGPDR